MNIAAIPAPGRLRRRVRRARSAPAVLLITIATSGCVISEVTTTRDGETVTENDVPNSEDIDPCGLDESVLLDLSIDPADLARGSGSRPTCSWETGPYSDPALHYWISGATPVNPANDLKVLDNGLTVEVYYDSEGVARYILRMEEHTFDVSYSADLPLDPTAPQAVTAVMDHLLALYGVSP